MKSGFSERIFSGEVLVVFAAVLWGTSGVAQAFAPIEASPSVVGFMRIFTGGLFLTGVSFFKKEFSDFNSFLTPMFFVTGFCQAMFQFCYFAGISLTGVAVGVMAAIGSSPVFSGILGFVFDKDKMESKWFFSTALAVSGLFLLTLSDLNGTWVDLKGLFICLCAGFFYSLFTFFSKRIIRDRPVDAVLGVSFLTGVLYLLPCLFFQPVSWIFTQTGMPVVLYLGIISAGISYMFYGRGLKKVNVSSVGTLTLAEPLTASLLGVLLLGERFSLFSGAGIFLIFISQIILVFKINKNKEGFLF